MPPRVNVRSMRDRLGLSAQKLADHLGVHLRTVQRWDTGEAVPSPLALKQLRDLDTARRSTEPEVLSDGTTVDRVRATTGLVPSNH